MSIGASNCIYHKEENKIINVLLVMHLSLESTLQSLPNAHTEHHYAAEHSDWNRSTQ